MLQLQANRRVCRTARRRFFACLPQILRWMRAGGRQTSGCFSPCFLRRPVNCNVKARPCHPFAGPPRGACPWRGALHSCGDYGHPIEFALLRSDARPQGNPTATQAAAHAHVPRAIRCRGNAHREFRSCQPRLDKI